MLTLLKIKNVALIDELAIEFGEGLNLLTGETGSGKSIIVDSLGALTGERVTSDLIKQGEESARIEGIFTLTRNRELDILLDETGIETDRAELIIRRDLSIAGKNRVFVNNQLVTQTVLKRLGPHLADIHGQGDQDTLYDTATHIDLLDDFADVENQISAVATTYGDWSNVRREMATLEKDESEKLQLVDILKFQVAEIEKATLASCEDEELEAEKRRVGNAEKLSTLSTEVHSLLYESETATAATLERAMRKIAELAEFDPRFREYDEGLAAAQAVIQDAAIAARDFAGSFEFSPGRLDEIENRLAEIATLKRKYGETINDVLQHLEASKTRLENIETAEFREAELRQQLEAAADNYRRVATDLSDKRSAAAAKFGKRVETDLRAVALEKARFEVRVESVETFSPTGSDKVEFYFSANPGEQPRPLARVASGGEASRLMLILKTAVRNKTISKTAVFDEIDIGIGGRVAEAVGRKLKALAANQQVFCVTHQPQIASLADRHFVVEKQSEKSKTKVTVQELAETERVDEIARMLAGERITDAARDNAKAMLAASSPS